jgi:hypothetical protein
VRWVNRHWIHPPTRLSSCGGVVFSSCCSGGGGVGFVVTIGSGGGGGGGQTLDPITVDPRSASLAPDLGARVPVGVPLGLIWILVICLYAGLSGELSTDITLMESSSSVSLATMTPSSPSLGLSDDNTVRLGATG